MTGSKDRQKVHELSSRVPFLTKVYLVKSYVGILPRDRFPENHKQAIGRDCSDRSGRHEDVDTLEKAEKREETN